MEPAKEVVTVAKKAVVAAKSVVIKVEMREDAAPVVTLKGRLSARVLARMRKAVRRAYLLRRHKLSALPADKADVEQEFTIDLATVKEKEE